ncbi:MAG: universal stress protein [Acidobacteriota bacterium]|nr:universal stress protein [Acidobacteriota bacterium]
MYPWRRVLIPTDFSTAAEWGFDEAIRIAGSTGAELLILHIRMTRISAPEQLRFPAGDAVYEYAEKQELENLRERVRRANSAVATRLLVRSAPDPGDEIGRTARSEQADLIVIATHARHHVAHLIIGSTTWRVITDPPAPVLAIRYGIRKRTGFKRIVVPVHLLQTSEAAAELAAAVAKREGGEVQFLIVCGDADRNAADSKVDEVASRLGIAPKKVIITGENVEREVVRYVAESNADAVFVNSQHEIGAVKQEIIRRISTPVMIVPAK